MWSLEDLCYFRGRGGEVLLSAAWLGAGAPG